MLALLCVSGFMFLAPAIAPVHAATTNSPTLSFFPGSLQYGAYSTAEHAIQVNVTNPASNTVGIEQFTINAPSGFQFINYAANSDYGCVGGIFGVDYDTGSGCATSTSTATFGANIASTTTPGTGVALPPGATTWLYAGLEIVPTSATYPKTYTFTTSWVDTQGGYHSGPSFTFTVFSPSAAGGHHGGAIDIHSSVTAAKLAAYPAGSGPITFTSNIGVAEAGVFVSWRDYNSYATFAGTGAVCFDNGALCGTYTNANGIATIKYYPNSTAGTSASLYASLGANPCTFEYGCYYGNADEDQYWAYNSTTVTTIAGTPAKVAINLAPGNASTTAPNNYITTSSYGNAYVSGTSPNYVQISLTDKFGNPSAIKAGDRLLVSATNGWFNETGATKHTSFNASITPDIGKVHYTVEYPYEQSGTYGTASSIVAALTRSGTTFSGTSGQMITTTFDSATNIPSVMLANGTLAAPAHFKQAVGGKVTLDYTLTTPQKGVPVELFVDSATSTQVNGDGAFSNGAQAITLTTNSSGIAITSFTLDTGSGAALFFAANVTAPINGAAINGLGAGSDSQNITTVAGAPVTMVLKTYHDSALSEPAKYVTNTVGSVLYVNIALADKYGNPAADNLGYQLQITLSAPGSLSVSSAYIKKGSADTNGSFGPILWTTPTTLGTATLTATSSLGSASKTVTVVPATPSLYVNTVNSSPLVSGSTFYVSTTFVSINGNASVSMGYPSTENITSVCYTMGTGASGCATITDNNTVQFSVQVSLASGLNHITLNATDTQTNTVSSSSFTILVDSTPPVVTFVTPANANISSPATVSANIVDSMGDLNATSVSAVATNTDTGAVKTATVSVTGGNNPGHSVTYGVTISGLATGNWSVVLSASDLALNSNSSTIMVHVTVPFAQSFVVSGTPSSATVGSFAGISASYTNLNPTSQSVVVFAVFKNSAGQTMGIGTGSATLAAGATQSVFIADPVGLASGTYTVNIFVFTTGNLPVSAQTTISVTV